VVVIGGAQITAPCPGSAARAPPWRPHVDAARFSSCWPPPVILAAGLLCRFCGVERGGELAVPVGDQEPERYVTDVLTASRARCRKTSKSRRVTRQPLQPAQARQIDFGLPPPGTRTFPRPGLPAATSSTGAVPSGKHVSGGYTNRADRNYDLAGGGPASPGRVGSAPFHRRTSGRVLPDSVELDEMTSRTT
jgi:hypothetical protein